MLDVLLASLIVSGEAPPGSPTPTPLPPSGPETRDRVPAERLEELVAAPMAILATDGLEAAIRDFEQLLAQTRQRDGNNSVAVADLLTAFGVGLFMATHEADDEVRKDAITAASLTYLQASVTQARATFGSRHPEVALALTSYADALLQRGESFRWRPTTPPDPDAIAALREALSIRLETLGPQNRETCATKERLARLLADGPIEAPCLAGHPLKRVRPTALP